MSLIENLRALRKHFIHRPMIKRSYAGCTPLFQLIKLINAMRLDPSDTILQTIVQNRQPLCQLSYNINLTLYHPGVGGFKSPPPPIICPHAFNFGAALMCVGDFSQKIV